MAVSSTLAPLHLAWCLSQNEQQKKKYLLNEYKQRMMYDSQARVSFPQTGPEIHL